MTTYESKSNEEEISSCFKAAIEKLDRVEADAEKEKTQIVKDLAKDLEGRIPTDRICNEIVHQLHGKKISPRTIRKCLDKKYKEKHRVENAQKQKSKTQDLAAPVPLEQEKPKQQIAATKDGKSVLMDDTSTNKEPYPISDSVNEPHDQSKQNGIGTNNEGRTADADTKVVTHPFNGEIIPVNKQSEDLVDRKENFVSYVPMSFDNLRKDMATVFQITKGVGNVFFKIRVDLGTFVVRINFCGITQENGIPMTSTAEGRMLKEGN